MVKPFGKINQEKAKIIIVSHLGRPKGKEFQSYRLSLFIIIL